MAFNRSPIFRLVIVLAVLALPVAAYSADLVGKASGGGASIEWQLSVSGHEAVELTVVAPNGEVYAKRFTAGRTPSFRLLDLGSDLADGQYTYQLRVVPKISAELKSKLEKSRAAGDDAASRKIIREAGIVAPEQSGSFAILNGSMVSPSAIESGSNATGPRSITSDAALPPPKLTPAVEDQVIADDLIVQGSACIGFDCVNNESFGFDTIRLKENSTRIKFEDTSAAGFPSNDWQLTANDSTGSGNKFSIDDITGSKTPLTVTAGAATNSLFIDSTGRIGFRTATPGLDLHISTSNTPAIRLEQTSAGGFTAQTWDVAGNEANFFVRDVTGGSRLPFRIRPGAPTSSIDINASGFVGIGTASPARLLHLTASSGNAAMQFTNSSAKSWHLANSTNDFNFSETGVADARFFLKAGGNVGINCNAPGAALVVASGGGCSNPASSLNPGDAQFTVSSSRTFKENIAPVAVPDILDRIEKVGVYNYDFINGPTDRIGLIAEDFHGVLGRGDDKHINGSEVQVALWLAVQQLTAQNKALTERLNALEKELPSQPAQ
jgi:hypothetical protein